MRNVLTDWILHRIFDYTIDLVIAAARHCLQ